MYTDTVHMYEAWSISVQMIVTGSEVWAPTLNTMWDQGAETKYINGQSCADTAYCLIES